MLPIVVDVPPAFAPANEVFAWTPNTPAGTWPAQVTFVLALPRSRDVGSEAAAELDVALRTWRRVPCTAVRTSFGGEVTVAPGDDGVNAVFFHDDAWPPASEPTLVPGVVAQTIVHVDTLGRYRDADIHLNGAEFRFSLDGAEGTFDLRSILVHEIGHALGLGHATDPRATMFASGSGARWRSLEKDDVDGICALYPNPVPGSPLPGCDESPCPAPFVCVGGACQRPGERSDLCSPCERAQSACEAAGDDARCIDIGNPSKGRVCGRPCTDDTSCTPGFHCVATTEAGDFQCVSDVACRNGANPCTSDAECRDSICRDGACVGSPPPAAEAGAVDAAVPSTPEAPPNSSCDCGVADNNAGFGSFFGVILTTAIAFLRRQCSKGRTEGCRDDD